MEACAEQTQPKRKGTGYEQFLTWIRAFFNSYIFYIFETFAACVFVAMNREVEGAVVFVALISLILLLCDDILPTTLPFLLLCTFTTNCYDSFDTFMQYAIYAPVPVMSFLYHFIVYRKPFTSGESVYGICAVSIAILLGGLGNFSLTEYAVGSYYVLGLGLGMIAAYFLLRSQFMQWRAYNFRNKFAAIMTLEGVLCIGMIVIGYWRFYHGGNPLPDIYPLGFSRNNISTMMMFAMPFPLYFGLHKYLWAIFTPLIYAGICLTTSRGGLIFGSIEFLTCCLYWIFSSYHKKTRFIRLAFCLIAGTVVVLSCGRVILDVILDRLAAKDVITGDARWRMLLEAVYNFKKNPLVGTGILDDSIFYGEFRKQGTMAWYHMMIPQIFGSMGLVGAVAYIFQFLGRGKLILKKRNRWSFCLGISYLGILLMSQVNPGEFCPLPFELLTVLLFVLQERRLEKRKPLPVEGMRG